MSDPKADACEALRYRAGRRDMVIFDALEADDPEAGLHHLVDRGHSEQKLSAGPQDAMHLAKRPLELVEVFEN